MLNISSANIQAFRNEQFVAEQLVLMRSLLKTIISLTIYSFRCNKTSLETVH